MINSIPKVTRNQTVMNFTREFVLNSLERKRKIELKDINSVRLRKGILLPFKLVGIDRREQTNIYMNNYEELVAIQKHLD